MKGFPFLIFSWLLTVATEKEKISGPFIPNINIKKFFEINLLPKFLIRFLKEVREIINRS